MMRVACVVTLIALLSGCMIAVDPTPGTPAASREDRAERDPRNPTLEWVEKMIARHGPIIELRNDEGYLPDDPEYVLDNGVTLNWGIVENPGDYNTFSCRNVQSLDTSSATLLEDVELVKESIESSPDPGQYKYWLKIPDRLKPGSLRRAKAMVHVLPVGALNTEIQFWIFYPFNGPGRVEVCASSNMCDDNWLGQCGRHYGDWEMVSILVSNLTEELVSVYMSRHSTEEIFSRHDDGTFRSVGDPRRTLHIQRILRRANPQVYSAISSHAHYPSAGNHNYKRVFSFSWGLGTASADLFDRTAVGRSLNAYSKEKYRIVASDIPGIEVEEPDWMQFQGRWGQYEKLTDRIDFGPVKKIQTYSEVGAGPTGPRMKAEWEGVF